MCIYTDALQVKILYYYFSIFIYRHTHKFMKLTKLSCF